MKKKTFNIFLSLLSLSIGGFIYISTRPDSYVSVVAESVISLDNIRACFSFLDIELIKYYLPDFLWSLSLTCALFAINKSTVQVTSIAVICGVLWEVSQATGLISGTADILDILMYLTAIIVAVLINKKGVFKNEKEQN